MTLHNVHSSHIGMTTYHTTLPYISHSCLHAQKDASHSTYIPMLFRTTVYERTRNNLTVSTHNVHATAPRARSYNYIFKVLFTAPSWYVFSIGFGHMSICWWDVAPIRIPFQRNVTRTVYTVDGCVRVAYGAFTLISSMLQIVFTHTPNSSTCVYNNSIHMALFPIMI